MFKTFNLNSKARISFCGWPAACNTSHFLGTQVLSGITEFQGHFFHGPESTVVKAHILKVLYTVTCIVNLLRHWFLRILLGNCLDHHRMRRSRGLKEVTCQRAGVLRDEAPIRTRGASIAWYSQAGALYTRAHTHKHAHTHTHTCIHTHKHTHTHLGGWMACCAQTGALYLDDWQTQTDFIAQNICHDRRWRAQGLHSQKFSI